MTELAPNNIAEREKRQNALIEQIIELTSTSDNVERLGKGAYALDIVNKEQWLKTVENQSNFTPIILPERTIKLADSENKYMERIVTTAVLTGLTGLFGTFISSTVFIPHESLGLVYAFVGSPIVGVLSFFGICLPAGRFSDRTAILYGVINIVAQGFQKWALTQHQLNLSIEEAQQVVTKLLYSGSRIEADCVIERENQNYVFYWDKDNKNVKCVKSKRHTQSSPNLHAPVLETVETKEPIALPSDIQSAYSAVLTDTNLLTATDWADEANHISDQLKTAANDYRKIAHLDDEGLAAQKLMTVVSLLQDDVKSVKRKVLEAGLADLDIHQEYLIARQKLQGTAHPIQLEN